MKLNSSAPILLATTNQYKIQEYVILFQQYAPNLSYITLFDLKSYFDDAPETGLTFLANANQKADYYFKKYQLPVLVDDSGLEVFNLNNFPGIYSKRWLNNQGFVIKTKTLLKRLQTKPSDCQYVCALVYLDNVNHKSFIAKIRGKLIDPKNKEGFGFDPGFYLPDLNQTFYELDLTTKNQISHRAKAFKQFIKWVNSK